MLQIILKSSRRQHFHRRLIALWCQKLVTLVSIEVAKGQRAHKSNGCLQHLSLSLIKLPRKAVRLNTGKSDLAFSTKVHSTWVHYKKHTNEGQDINDSESGGEIQRPIDLNTISKKNFSHLLKYFCLFFGGLDTRENERLVSTSE